jgi:hypothetical protein
VERHVKSWLVALPDKWNPRSAPVRLVARAVAAAADAISKAQFLIDAIERKLQ